MGQPVSCSQHKQAELPCRVCGHQTLCCLLSRACRHRAEVLYSHRPAVHAVWMDHCNLDGLLGSASFAYFSVLHMRHAGSAGELYEDVTFGTAYPYASLDYGQSFITVRGTGLCNVFRGVCIGRLPAKPVFQHPAWPTTFQVHHKLWASACCTMACPYCHQRPCSSHVYMLKQWVSVPCCVLLHPASC